jgi:hypothetical protein
MANVLHMSDVGQPSGRMWNYLFLVRSEDESAEVEIERQEFNTDEDADSWGRELSKKHNSSIVIKRHSAYVDGWDYVGEVGETPA